MDSRLDNFKDFMKSKNIALLFGHRKESNEFLTMATTFLFEAFEREQVGEKSAFKDLVKANEAFRLIVDVMNDNSGYSMSQPHIYSRLIASINFLESYEGIGKETYYISQVKLIKLKKDLNDAFYPSEDIVKERRREKELARSAERDKGNGIYNQLEVTITPEDVNKYIMHKNFLTKKKILKNDINYPVLMFFYKGGELIDIRKESISLDKKLRILAETVDFDEYKVLEVPKDKVNELFYEALIKFRPKSPLKSLSLYPAANYKTMTDVKRRYFGRLTPKKIMKIIELHSVPMHSFDNGLIIVHRDLLDKAIQENRYIKNFI